MLSFLSGATAGAAATMASYPFDLLRTLLAAQGKPPVRCAACILGLETSVLLDCPTRAGTAHFCVRWREHT